MRLAAVALLLVSVTARAEDKADALFKKGKKLLADKKYAEACAAFQQSDELDPGIGAKLNTAHCFEEWGRLATALHWYQDAEKLAKDASDARAAKIDERIAALDPDVPRLTLHGPKGADASSVTVDGVAAKLEDAIAVDPGPHVIAFTSASGEVKKKTLPMERGGSSEVTLDLPRPGAKAPVTTPVAVAEDRTGRGQRIAGIAVGATGLAAIAVAGYVTLHARSNYNSALAVDCMGSTSMCDPDGLTATHDARHQANIATVITIVGAAAVAGGVVIYLIAPHPRSTTEHALYLAPAGTSVVLGGSF